MTEEERERRDGSTWEVRYSKMMDEDSIIWPIEI
jgi:hypothetical protein